MKFVFFSGGLLGFVVAAATGYFSGRGPDRIFLDGAVGCLAGAFLLRWFWNVVLQGIRETYLLRQQAVLAAVANPAPAVPVPSPAAAVPARPAPLAPIRPRT
jgi:hypothetical protein